MAASMGRNPRNSCSRISSGIGDCSPQISKETQQLLKLMMEESKLTNFQRKQLNSRVKDGKALPVTCNPTSSSKGKPKSCQPVKSKETDRKNSNFSGKRPKEVIDILVERDDEPAYKPLPGKLITEKDKRQLQFKMAYGEDIPDLYKSSKKKTEILEEPADEIDEFDDVLNQIEERQEFLKEMEGLGQGKKYRPIIQTEISQKIRELELIDKQRTKHLESLLENNEIESPLT